MVASTMRRNRFEKIKEYLHFAPAEEKNDGDRYWKIRRMMDSLNRKFMEHGIPTAKPCIDESMCPYFGKHPCKMFIHGKPVGFGFKIWCLCDKFGYLYQFLLYQTGEPKENREFGVGAAVILALLSTVPNQNNITVYADRFFSSVHLCEPLAARGIG